MKIFGTKLNFFGTKLKFLNTKLNLFSTNLKFFGNKLSFLVLNLIFSAAHMSHRINDMYKTVSRAEKFLGVYSKVIVYCNTIFLVGDTFLGIRVSLREIYIKFKIYLLQ